MVVRFATPNPSPGPTVTGIIQIEPDHAICSSPYIKLMTMVLNGPSRGLAQTSFSEVCDVPKGHP